jgi:hypothetical protein
MNMRDIAFLKDAHYISLYVIIGIATLLLIYIFILIWMRKRSSLLLFPPLILLVWYTFGFGWRLGFFGYVSYISNFVGGSAENYIAIKGDIPKDVAQLLSDENLAEEIMRPSWINKIPELKIISRKEGDELNLQVYWIGFDKDDDKFINNEFPGWFRLLYLPWFYDGDILIYECFYEETEIKLYSLIQKEYKTIKYVLLLHDIIRESDGEIATRIGKRNSATRCIQDLYLATKDAYSKTLGKQLNEQEIDESLDYIKKAEYIYLPRNRLKDLELLLKPEQ